MPWAWSWLLNNTWPQHWHSSGPLEACELLSSACRCDFLTAFEICTECFCTFVCTRGSTGTEFMFFPVHHVMLYHLASNSYIDIVLGPVELPGS